jgi:hypothetical protein
MGLMHQIKTRSTKAAKSKPQSAPVDIEAESLPKPIAKPLGKRKAGRPRIEDKDKTLESQKPWQDLGMSKRTWFRRQKELRER